jgi:hypothetical protein
MANQIITTKSEIANGLRLLFMVDVDTANWPFKVFRDPIGKEPSLPLGYGCATP